MMAEYSERVISHRDRHAPLFKAKNVACLPGNALIVQVSLEFGLNTNLVQTWIRKARRQSQLPAVPDFMPLQVPPQCLIFTCRPLLPQKFVSRCPRRAARSPYIGQWSRRHSTRSGLKGFCDDSHRRNRADHRTARYTRRPRHGAGPGSKSVQRCPAALRVSVRQPPRQSDEGVGSRWPGNLAVRLAFELGQVSLGWQLARRLAFKETLI